MTKKHLFSYICIITVYFILFFIALLNNTIFIRNLLWLTTSAGTAILAIYTFINSQAYNKILYRFFSVLCVFWFLSCTLFLCYNGFYSDVFQFPLLHVAINQLTNLYILVSLLTFTLKYLMPKLNIYQYIWDTIIITECAAAFVWYLFLKDNYWYIFSCNLEYIFRLSFLCIGVLTLNLLYTIYSSIQDIDITLKYRFLFIIIILNSVKPIYTVILSKGSLDKISFSFFILSLLFMCLSCIIELYNHDIAIKKTSIGMYNNIGDTKLDLLLLDNPLIIFLLKGFDAYILLFFTLSILTHHFVTKYIKTSTKLHEFLIKENSNELEKRQKEIELIQEMSMAAIALLAETRDEETGKHIQRTQLYVKILLMELKSYEAYKNYLTDDTIALIIKSAPLHDIGKVGIPDSILLKPGKLTEEEFEIMKNHTVIGRQALEKSELLINRTETYFKFAKEIVYFHHEKWDGSGYPAKLSGESIPLSARIMALADVYDALVSKRIYKAALTHDEAVNIIENDSEKHFDPTVVCAFIKLSETFKQISTQLMD